MACLDDFLANVTTPDTRKRIQSHAELVPYLSDPTSSLACSEIDDFIGGLTAWVNSSNYKVCIYSDGVTLISVRFHYFAILL